MRAHKFKPDLLRWPILLFTAIPLFCLGAETPEAVENNDLDTGLSAVELSGQLAQFEQSISEIERSGGAYDQRLVEALMGAGRLSLEQKRFNEAASLFERALSVSRISGGLLNAEQLQILTLLVASSRGAGDWSNADDKAHLALYLQKRLLAPNSEEYALAVLAFGEWKLAAVHSSSLKLNDYSELLALEDLHAELLRGELNTSQVSRRSMPLLALQAGHLSEKTRAELLNQIALSRFDLVGIQVNAMRGGRSRFEAPQYVYQNVCRTVAMQDGSSTRVCSQQRVPNPAYWEQQRERANLRFNVESDVREFSDTHDALRVLAQTAPEVILNNGLTINAQSERLSELQLELEKATNFLRFW